MNEDSPSSFEDALGRLQELVQQLETGDHGLDASLLMFEEGTRLLRDCYRRLEQAEKRIEILTGFDAAGNPVTAPFDASSSLEKSRPPSSETTPKTPRKRGSRKADSPNVSEEDGQGELPF